MALGKLIFSRPFPFRSPFLHLFDPGRLLIGVIAS
jgi:hypothetical protein